jgi:hypothetical protein
MASPIARHSNGAGQPITHSESTVVPSVSSPLLLDFEFY